MEVQVTPLPMQPVSSEGYIMQLPAFSTSQLDQAYNQCLAITLAALGVLLVVKFMNSLK